jgi:predicted regulator of Ras-like GTPase activity (Roadblock/LC7/MglB family)
MQKKPLSPLHHLVLSCNQINVLCATLCNQDGMVLENFTPAQSHQDALATLSAALIAITQSFIPSLGRTSVDYIHVANLGKHILIIPMPNQTVLSLVTNHPINTDIFLANLERINQHV